MQSLTLTNCKAKVARVIAGIFVAVLVATVAEARPLSATELAGCFNASSKEYGVNVYLIKAIALHESNLNPRAINNKNFDDSEDIGIMQINSWWLSNSLNRYGIDRDKLWNPCLNIRVGTWILAQEIAKHGRGWTAIGYYNARTEEKRLRYIERIKASLKRVYHAYGVADASPDDPTRPVLQVPTQHVMLDRVLETSKTPLRVQTKKGGGNEIRRKIIVVSAESPQAATR